MSRLSLVILFATLSRFSIAQISPVSKSPVEKTVGRVAPFNNFLCELVYISSHPEDTICVLRFRNAKYESINKVESLIFIERGGVKEQLYRSLKEVFSKENRSNPKYEVTFTLGKNPIVVRNYKGVGGYAATIYTQDAWVHLTEKSVDQLFGKR